jgi:hypothetical protein
VTPGALRLGDSAAEGLVSLDVVGEQVSETLLEIVRLQVIELLRPEPRPGDLDGEQTLLVCLRRIGAHNLIARPVKVDICRFGNGHF